MKLFNFSKLSIAPLLLLMCSLLLTSCGDDDATPDLGETEIAYAFHNGQTVATAPYAGTHKDDFSADMMLEEMENGNTMITVTLMNTVDGQTYNIHAHDAADPTTTPNGTPYNETPNGDVFAGSVIGNGGTVELSQQATMSYDALLTTYDAFFVIHDPLQDLSTTDISTYLVVGAFARSQANPDFSATTFNYDFNTGQIAEAFAYNGTHPDDLSASIRVAELAGDQTRITVTINNTVNGETYNTHAHDAADPATTPNGTPYNETPNGDVFAGPLMGNAGSVSSTNISSLSYINITTIYEGFFVVHDPLQTLDTTDPTTYVVLGNFAR